MLLQIFNIFYFGNELSLTSTKVSVALFHTEWAASEKCYNEALEKVLKESMKLKDEKSRIELRKSFEAKWRTDDKNYQTAKKIFLENAIKTSTVKAYGFLAINLITFLNIVNFAYSLFKFVNLSYLKTFSNKNM